MTKASDSKGVLTDAFAGKGALRVECVTTAIGESQRIHREMTRLIGATRDRCSEMATGVCDLIARETGLEFVRVSQFVEFDDAGRPIEAEVFAGKGGNEDVIGERYQLETSPCSGVEQFCAVCIPEGVAGAFPKDEHLREMSIESYAGVAITSNAGEQVGLVYAMSTRPLDDAPGAMRRMQLIVHRFSAEVDRYFAAQEKERSEERYRSRVDAMADGLVVVREGKIVVANARAAAARGVRSAADLVGSRIGYASGQDPAAEGFESLQHLRCDDRMSAIDCSVTPIEHEGERAVQVIERHLNDAHERERLMIRTFDLMPLAVMVITSDDRLLRMNGAMRSLCDRVGVDDLRSVLDCLTPRHARALERLVARSRAEGGSHSADVIDRDGGSDARVVMWSVHNDEHDGTCVISAEDITSRRSAERVLMQEERTATTALLASGLVHDLGNLLGAINAQVHVAEQRLGPVHKAEEEFEGIREVLSHAHELRDSLQTLGGHAGFAQRDVCVPQLLRETDGLLERLVGETGSVRFRVDPSESCVVRGDPGRLRQVLVNLVGNARDAIKSAGRRDGQIDVDVVCAAESVVITVSDNGPGVRPSLEERIFEPFFTTRSRSSGTGLGLAISRAIIEQHGGTIALEEWREGRGASFRVRLPRVDTQGWSVRLEGVEAALVYEDGHERAIVAGLLERLGMLVVDDPVRARVVICCDGSCQSCGGAGKCLVVRDPDGVACEGAVAGLQRPFGLADLERGVRRVLLEQDVEEEA